MLGGDLTDEPGPMTPGGEGSSPRPSNQLPDVKLIPVLPKNLGRYKMADRHVPSLRHPIYSLLFCDPLDPYGLDGRQHWDRHVHPEGNPYYYHNKQQIVTFCNILDDAVSNLIRAAEVEIKRRIRVHLPLSSVQPELPITRPDVEIDCDEWHYGIPDWELCVNVDVLTRECKYYIADWKNRCLFWLAPEVQARNPYDQTILDAEKLGIQTPTSWFHTHTMLQSHFWKHADFFPHRKIPEQYICEVKDYLMWAFTDRKTSPSSTVNLSVEDLRSFREMLTFDKADSPDRGSFNAVVARLSYEMCVERAINMYGEHTARLSRHQSRFFQAYNHFPLSFLPRALSFVLLFNQPQAWYMKLCETWIDKIVHAVSWRRLMKDVQEEWKSTGFMAPVVLAANMGFLTINPLGDSVTPSAVTARTLSVLSTVTSIGSIMSAMLLLHGHREMAQSTLSLETANEYFVACECQPTGLFGAAMLYSMPFGMLLWSLIVFVAAILAFSFAQWEHLASPILVFMILLVLLMLVCQMYYFRRLAAPRAQGSDWKDPKAGARPRALQPQTAPPPGPGIIKRQTFRTLSRLSSAATAVDGIRRRGSNLLKRGLSWSTSPPQSPKLPPDLEEQRHPAANEPPGDSGAGAEAGPDQASESSHSSSSGLTAVTPPHPAHVLRIEHPAPSPRRAAQIEPYSAAASGTSPGGSSSLQRPNGSPDSSGRIIQPTRSAKRSSSVWWPTGSGSGASPFGPRARGDQHALSIPSISDVIALSQLQEGQSGAPV